MHINQTQVSFPQTSKPEFRNDINLLRAIAVSLVVAFHFGIPGFVHGFYGVDIFIVISGYLMAQIIATSKIDGLKGIFQFWLARGRRIIPAYYVLLLIIVILAAYFLLPFGSKAINRSATEALYFNYNNKLLTLSHGYFLAGELPDPLLHTWSLALEWQFYITLPLLMFWVRAKPKLVAGIYLIIATLSFSLGVATHHLYDPNLAFYALPLRAWEFCIGGLIYLAAKNRRHPALGWTGIGLIISSLILAPLQWTPLWAFAVACGTGLVVHNRFDANWFQWRPITFMGNASYSIYLWHWPLALVPAYLQSQSPILIISLIVGSLVLGGLSWRFVEGPSRQFLVRQHWSIQIGTAIIMAIVILVTIKHFKPGRALPELSGYSQELHKITTDLQRFANCGEFDTLYCHKTERPIFTLLGDSHAEHLSMAFGRKDIEFNAALAPGCPMIVPSKKNQDLRNCGKKFNSTFPLMPTDTPLVHVIFGGNQFARSNDPKVFADEYRQSLCEWAKTRPVYVVRQTPVMPTHPAITLHLAHQFGFDKSIQLSQATYESDPRYTRFNDLQDSLKSCGVKIIEVKDLFCRDKSCDAVIDGKLMYYDDDHLSSHGTALLADRVLEELAKPQ